MGRCEFCKKLTTQKSITFHRFPKNESDRKKWIQNMGKPDWEPTRTAVLCSEHFTSDCFERWWNITRLRKGSVPTVFGNDTSQANEKSNEVQSPPKKTKVDTTPLTTDLSPPNLSGCALGETTGSIEAILRPMSREISVQTQSTATTPKSSKVTPKTSRFKEIVTHDHCYEDTPRTSHKKLIALRQKYGATKNTVKTLQRRVKNLKTRVSSLRKVVSTLTKKKKKMIE